MRYKYTVCARCEQPECDCPKTAEQIEQARRLEAGFARLEAMSEEERRARDIEKIRRATTGYPESRVTDDDFDAPSRTRWQRDVEADRMRDSLR